MGNKDDLIFAALSAAKHAADGMPDAVADWLSDHVDPETGYVVDNTLSIQGAAADAKAVGDKINGVQAELDESGLYAEGTLDLRGYDTVGIAIGASNKWNVSGTSKFIPADGLGKGITVKSHASNGSVICFLTANTYAHGSTVTTYCSGTGRTFIAAGVTKSFVIPDDCQYINLLDYWDNDYIPQYVKYTQNGMDKLKDQTMAEDRIGLTVPYGWRTSTSVRSTAYNSQSGENNQGRTSAATSDLQASPFIPVYGKMLQLPIMWASDATYPNYGMCLYDEDFQPIPGRAISAIPNRPGEEYIRWVSVYLPENAKYFRTTYWTDSFRESKTPEISDFTYNLLKEIPDEYQPITHELPVDTYMQNAIRRARQLTDIRWTPRVNIPRYSMIYGSTEHFLDWFYSDHEYVGIPYSGAGDDETHWSTIKDWGYTHNWVGQHIPIEAFVTAARYPNSIMGEKVSQSAASYDSSPFGDVCTALVNYAVDGPTPLRGITGFFDTSDRVFRDSYNNISDTNLNAICIGDFLYTQAHVIIITDLMRDANGNVTHVEMSEETTVGNGNNTVLGTKFGGVARRKMWDANEFKALYGAYRLYRRTTFYGIPYTRSKYVNTGNEGEMETIVDYPCIPYLGEGAIYKSGYIHNSKICIGANGFTSLIVKKDGEEFGTFDVTGLTEVSVGFADIGSYEAYLSKTGGVITKACHWTVVA